MPPSRNCRKACFMLVILHVHASLSLSLSLSLAKKQIQKVDTTRTTQKAEDLAWPLRNPRTPRAFSLFTYVYV